VGKRKEHAFHVERSRRKGEGGGGDQLLSYPPGTVEDVSFRRSMEKQIRCLRSTTKRKDSARRVQGHGNLIPTRKRRKEGAGTKKKRGKGFLTRREGPDVEKERKGTHHCPIRERKGREGRRNSPLLRTHGHKKTTEE